MTFCLHALQKSPDESILPGLIDIVSLQVTRQPQLQPQFHAATQLYTSTEASYYQSRVCMDAQAPHTPCTKAISCCALLHYKLSKPVIMYRNTMMANTATVSGTVLDQLCIPRSVQTVLHLDLPVAGSESTKPPLSQIQHNVWDIA